jgi:hypothetical protein
VPYLFLKKKGKSSESMTWQKNRDFHAKVSFFGWILSAKIMITNEIQRVTGGVTKHSP